MLSFQILLLPHSPSPFVLKLPLNIYQTLYATSTSFTYCCVFHYFLFLCFNLDIFYHLQLPFHQSSSSQCVLPNPSLSLCLSVSGSVSGSLCFSLPPLPQFIVIESLCYSTFLCFLSLLIFVSSVILSIRSCFCMTFASVSCLF